MNVRIVNASKVNARRFRLNYSLTKFSRTTGTSQRRDPMNNQDNTIPATSLINSRPAPGKPWANVE